MSILKEIANDIKKICVFVWELAKYIGCLLYALLVIAILSIVSIFKPDTKTFRDECWDKLVNAMHGV